MGSLKNDELKALGASTEAFPLVQKGALYSGRNLRARRQDVAKRNLEKHLNVKILVR